MSVDSVEGGSIGKATSNMCVPIYIYIYIYIYQSRVSFKPQINSSYQPFPYNTVVSTQIYLNYSIIIIEYLVFLIMYDVLISL